MRSHPNVMARYTRFVNDFRMSIKEAACLSSLQEFVPRLGWQTELSELLKSPVDRRKVYVVTDTVGDSGKTYFAENFDPTGSMIVNNGSFADIAYTFIQRECTRVVYFDYGRELETFPYRMVEALKNSVISSSKYESRSVRFEPVHVVIFTNTYVDLTKLSADRWHFVGS